MFRLVSGNGITGKYDWGLSRKCQPTNVTEPFDTHISNV